MPVMGCGGQEARCVKRGKRVVTKVWRGSDLFRAKSGLVKIDEKEWWCITGSCEEADMILR
jgi:hypothetical protein